MNFEQIYMNLQMFKLGITRISDESGERKGVLVFISNDKNMRGQYFIKNRNVNLNEIKKINNLFHITGKMHSFKDVNKIQNFRHICLKADMHMFKDKCV